MQMFGLSREGHGHNLLAQSVPVEREQIELDIQLVDVNNLTNFHGLP